MQPHAKEQAKRRMLQILKLVGIVLFLWILSRIDPSRTITYLKNADATLLALSFPLIFLMYAAKTLRSKALVESTGIRLSFSSLWRIYNIGIFLATITPGKVGEFGKAAFFRNKGMHGGTALMVVLLDRGSDFLAVGALAVISVGVLFGREWLLFATAAGTTGGILSWILWKKTHHIRQNEWLHFLKSLLLPRPIASVIASTLLSWIIYFGWAIVLSRIIGIMIGIVPLVSVFTVAGILALIPIAPSGLGTRDAALIALLGPFGVEPEKAVALAFLMFTSILLSSIPGGFYWLRSTDL